VGNVTGTAVANAFSPGDAYARAYGISDTRIGAGNGYGPFGDGGGTGTVGDVTGTAKATAISSGGSDYAVAHGVEDTYVYVGTGAGGTGTIGDIVGTAIVSDGPGGPGGVAYGIDPSVFYSTGGMGSITGVAIGATGGSAGIMAATFLAAGAAGMGPITASASAATDAAIIGSIFSTLGSIPSISAGIGNVIGSQFLAGFSVGANLVVGGADDVVVAGATIGSASVAGAFIGSDLIASVAAGADAKFGTADDAGTGSGSIGPVTIGLPAAGGAQFIADGITDNAIQAFSIAGITVGGFPGVPPTVIDNDLSGGITAGDVRVREL